MSRTGIIIILTLLCAGGLFLDACQGQKKTDDATVPVSSTPQTASASDIKLLNQGSGKIVFQSDRDGDWEIYVMNPDGSNLVQLTHNEAADEYAVWSPDGQRIAFKSDRAGNFDIYVMNADGFDQRQITTHAANDEDPAWSPDGSRIAFHSDRESGLEIYFIKPDGTGLTPFTKTMGRNGLPAWSPDGNYLAYTGNRYLGWNVYVTKLDKTDDKRVTDGHGACRPDWSPDGTQIAYVSAQDTHKTNIWLMNPDGSDKHPLTNDDDNYDYYPAWSPDGKYLVYAKSPDKDHGNWELYLVSADGSKQLRLTNHPAKDKFPDWYGGDMSDETFAALSVQQQFIYEAESSPHLIGKPQEDAEASNALALYADTSEGEGFVMYGPYASYTSGDYVASFRLKSANISSKKPVVFVDVTTDAGQTIIARQELKGRDFQKKNAYQDVRLPFSLQESRPLEFRVYSFAVAAIGLDKVTVVVSVDRKAP